MSRAIGVALLLAFAPAMPEGCAKLMGKTKANPSASAEPPRPAPTPAPAPIPVTSATAPPVWAPPDTGGTTTAAPTGSPSTSASAGAADLAKAREAAEHKEHKKVRTILEKKVKAGKGSPEEVELLLAACVALKDKACVDAAKAKHPPSGGDGLQ